MIRISPYYERYNSQDILVTYLQILKYGTSFTGQELYLLFTDKFHLKDEVVSLYVKNSKPTAKQRSKRHDIYNKMTKVGLLKFRDFLFDSDGNAIIENLYTLLTAPMIKEICLKNGLQFIEDFLNKDQKEVIEKIFKYDSLSSGDYSDLLYTFTTQMNVSVCPYCNRIFTSTTIVSDEKKGRPDIDHFWPKSIYPYFALSIMNWIPVCHICNISKHDKDYNILYPYFEGAGQNMHFVTHYSSAYNGKNYVIGEEGSTIGFKVETDIPDDPIDTDAYEPLTNLLQIYRHPFDAQIVANEYLIRLRNSCQLFAWETNAQHHKEYIRLIYKREYEFGRSYKASLHRTFKELFPSNPELTYLMDLRDERLGETPLSKLTRDISDELEDLLP